MPALFRSPLFWIFLGALCYYAALPPLNFAPLVLAVPICWGIAIRSERRETSGERRVNSIPALPVCENSPQSEEENSFPLASRPSSLTSHLFPRLSPLASTYFFAFLFWLASIWWIACPHPLTSLGLLALSAYLSLYWVLFFASARIAVHRLKIPLPIAMPICWIGCEYLRLHLLGGFSFCALEHALYRNPFLIQFASIGGGTLVGGIIMFLGALCVSCFTIMGKYRKIWRLFVSFIPFGFSILILLFMSLLGALDFSMMNYDTTLSIAGLQGNKPVRLNPKPNEPFETFQQFIDLTTQTVNERKQKGEPPLDLIVFPETVCHIPGLAFEGSIKPSDVGLTEESARRWEDGFRDFVRQIDTPILLGMSTYVFKDSDEPLRLNSAVLITPQRGEEPGKIYRYDKMHLVMFGEYIPFAEYLPKDFFLRTLCPEAQRGTKPVAMPIGSSEERGEGREAREEGREIPANAGTPSLTPHLSPLASPQITASVNICFESSVSHLIRRHILTLREEGHDPRLLINISNDGWFRFSQQIDQHLATHVFRAVENRMYYVTATNGGFSAIIDPQGFIREIGKRANAEAVVGFVGTRSARAGGGSPPVTLYQLYGDGYALVCALVMLGLIVFGFVAKKR